jgi:transposase-like protein
VKSQNGSGEKKRNKLRNKINQNTLIVGNGDVQGWSEIEEKEFIQWLVAYMIINKDAGILYQKNINIVLSIIFMNKLKHSKNSNERRRSK